MDKDQAIQKANGVFKKDASLKEMHFTSDGQGFSNKNLAAFHHKELGNKGELITITREECQLDAVVITEQPAESIVEQPVIETSSVEPVQKEDEPIIETGTQEDIS